MRSFPRLRADSVTRRRWSWKAIPSASAELEAMSNRVANGLVSIGVRPGDRVTLYGPNCWKWLVAYYAIAKTGAVVNPISSMLTAEEVRYVVADSGARMVVASIDKGVALLDVDGTDTLSDVVLWGDDVPAAATSFAAGSTRRSRTSRPCHASGPIWRRSVTRQGRRATRRGRCRAIGRSSPPRSGRC